MQNNHWFYINEDDNSCRYILGEQGANPMIIFGINPSIAEPTYIGKSDPTIDKIKRLVKKFDYDGWIMLNVYPQRSTNPKNLHKYIDKNIHIKNLSEIRNIFMSYPNMKLIAAWGNLITKRDYLIDCLNDIYNLSVEFNMEWFCFHKNKTGHPRHPLYLIEEKTQLIKYNLRPVYKFQLNKR
ncbi:MAG: DUF1643 domain-containing protein [Acholeplasmataceae bacterium]|nr:DUF1643 domain-containing protein [Acholeplasmataceae bacterium]